MSTEEQQAPASEVRNWALRRLKEDPTFEPRVLGDDSYQLPNTGRTIDDNHPVIALNFLEANDLSEAIAIARTYPGLNYGVTIEVRSWKHPRNAGGTRPQHRFRTLEEVNVRFGEETSRRRERQRK